jgi:hypothetical protein
VQDLTERLDPAVFGVAVSLAAFGGFTLALRLLFGTTPAHDAPPGEG